ncbi:hypothetical protein C8Q79DRAFT_1114217 [Trametes meyenii]|nr:hypothetical protein C8Q79DRAFT_1114217 [Trametes meyenii]
MQFSSLLAILPTFVAIALAKPTDVPTKEPIAYYPVNNDDGRISAVEGSPNGLYVIHNNTHAAYHGEADTQTVGKFGRVNSARAAADFTCDPSCNGQQHNAGDIQSAENGLASWFSSGLSWNHQIYYLQNSVYAFGCDYGNGQTTKASDYQASVSCVDSHCGSSQGGWDSIHDWKATYGREFGSFGC